MIQYFYYLHFQYFLEYDEKNSPIYSGFSLGFLSTHKKALEKIEFYRNIVGFNKHPIDCFKILKTGVRFDEKLKNKEGTVIYRLICDYEAPNGCEYWEDFGSYSSNEQAEEDMAIIKQQKKYKKHPYEFNIQKWIVDMDFQFVEGFVSWDDE